MNNKNKYQKTLKIKIKVSEKLILDRVIEFVNGNTDKEMPIKEKRTAMSKILSMIRLDKLGAEGIHVARKSKLFAKEALLQGVLNAKVMSNFVAEDHYP